MKINLRKVRKSKKLSIRQLSIKAGIARGYLSDLENGIYNNPTISVVCKLCKVLDCSLEELIDCEGEEDGRSLYSKRSGAKTKNT